ncbi:membrane dipeptidase [Singulisphaera sp. GP187]|uniref:dipeptidase n=1 Tax=Singulisphaera sp. GP187 TaxID=1882752 RepID=UPI0009276ECB|nr:membrane dipeptidase [Singulisphaera sp. GP187]SIO47105.1 membrane dipeptidase [Singulisphaera sp. GP187]
MLAFRQSRRQFLHAAAAASLAGRLGVRSARAAELGVDTGPFATANETIRAARRGALAILKPNEADLKRGLELHADALVFESYGFAPRGALDGASFAKAIEDKASDSELIDLREEMMMTRCATDAVERREFFEAFEAAGVTCIFQNSGEEGNDPLRLLKRLARFTFTTDTLRNELFKAVAPDEVVAAKQSGRRCLAFTTNGVPLPQRWESERDELQMLRIFRDLGVQMMHLTYNRRNPLGDGAGEPNDGGLSDFGRTAIAEMNRLGVIVDVAHSGWRTSLEAAKASAKPMVASHTTCGGLYKHFRGKPDDVARAICDTGGLIGICCIPRFLGGSGDIAAFLDHVDYAVKTFGADHVAIGTDVAYFSRNDGPERAKLPKGPGGRSPLALAGARWEHLWPKDDFRESPQGIQSLAWTNWPLFTVGLVQRGHSDETIRKILGLNVLRVWKANQPTKP